jgi:plastocyanin domain-containing protein
MMNTILVNGGGIVLMLLVIGWFWLWRPARAVAATGDAIDITVADGVYEPDFITARRGVPLALRFHRRDASPCAEQVIFHDLDISATLPVGKTKTIAFTPQRTGTYRFTCQMQMYQGKLQVVD